MDAQQNQITKDGDNLYEGIMIYDDQCTLCTRFKMALERLPGGSKFKAHSLHDAQLYVDFPQLNQEACKEELHLVDNKGTIHVGAHAIEFIIKHHPEAKKFAWLMESAMGQKTLDYFYQMCNKYRKMVRRSCGHC